MLAFVLDLNVRLSPFLLISKDQCCMSHLLSESSKLRPMRLLASNTVFSELERFASFVVRRSSSVKDTQDGIIRCLWSSTPSRVLPHGFDVEKR